MLGNGCPWYNQCTSAKKSGFQGQYCNSEARSRKCPERPMNYRNDKVANDFNYAKGTHSSVRIGQVLIVGVLILIGVWLLNSNGCISLF